MEKPEVYRQVARLHISCINQGFLPRLGESFLALMYRAIDESDDGALIVDTDGDRVIGFVSGTIHMKAVYRRMLRHWPTLFVALLPSMVRPHRVARILEILRYGGTHSTERPLPNAELLTIAIDSKFRGQRRADALYHRLSKYFAQNGQTEFKITAGAALEPAHRFYLRMGAEPIGEVQVHRGETSIAYVQRCL